VIHPFVKEAAYFDNVRLKGRILEVFPHCVGKGGYSPTSHCVSFSSGDGQRKEIMRQGHLLLLGGIPNQGANKRGF
jgi:hypothetical protein